MDIKKIFIFFLCFGAVFSAHCMGRDFAKFLFNKKALFAATAATGMSAAAFSSLNSPLNKEEPKSVHIPAPKTQFLFSHGLGGNKNNARAYQKSGILYSNSVHAFNYPDAKPNGEFDATQSSLGQEPDINALKTCYQRAAQNNEPVVMFGVSRGAATIINFLGAHPNTNVQAVVLESPFDHVDSVIKQKTGIFSSLAGSFVPYIYRKYNPNGPQPIKSIGNIRKDLPIIFTCSKQDALIPAASTQALYKELKKNGHEHVYLATLNTGAHANILWGNDRDAYVSTVHAFYQKYNVPHHKGCAQQGEELLEECQPTVEELAS